MTTSRQVLHEVEKLSERIELLLKNSKDKSFAFQLFEAFSDYVRDKGEEPGETIGRYLVAQVDKEMSKTPNKAS